MTADPDRACEHGTFEASVIVNRVRRSDDDPEVIGYSADVAVRCTDCDEPFRWTGLQSGVSPTKPMCSIDGTEMRAPLRPASADPDFGMGLPGFSVRLRD